MRSQRTGRWGLLLLPAWTAALTGCSTYTLHGNVTYGQISDMELVDPSDRRLSDPPLTSVRITVQRDPDKLSRRIAGTDVSDVRGRFVIPLDEFGAGWMEEEWLIRASKPGFKTATSILRLDANTRGKRLLIILGPGLSDEPTAEDLNAEFERFR